MRKMTELRRLLPLPPGGGGRGHLAALLLVAIIALLPNYSQVHCHPQYYPTQPRWDVESVILSRNGPSTRPPPTRSTTWTTTTLRSFGVETILGRGQSTVDELTNSIVNRPREVFKSAQPQVRADAHAHKASAVLIGLVAAMAAARFLLH